MMNPGATPNDTTSDSESKSPPIGECAFSSRAVKPSRKSNSPAAKIITAAITGIPVKENMMEKQPETRLQQVMALGMCCFNDMSSHGFQSEGPVGDSHLDQINARSQTIGKAAYLEDAGSIEIKDLGTDLAACH